MVTFKSANRPGYGATASDGVHRRDHGRLLDRCRTGTGGAFVTRSTSPINLTAGTHTLTFTGTTPSGDTGTAIDDVKVTKPALTNGSLTFQPGANTVCNKVTGSGTAVMNGKFYLDLSAAAIANGNSWTLVNHATLNESYGSDFSVTSSLGDFTESPAGTWKRVDGDNTWTFTKGTGVLTLAVAPPIPCRLDVHNYPGIDSPDNRPGGGSGQRRHKNLLEYVLKDGNPIGFQPRHPADRQCLRRQLRLHLLPPRRGHRHHPDLRIQHDPRCRLLGRSACGNPAESSGHHRLEAASTKWSSPCRKAPTPNSSAACKW